jgi:hypothetical protein
MLWSETASTDMPGANAYYARWDGERWTLPNLILHSLDGRVAQPALTAVGDRLHAVWSSQDAQIMYSAAFAQEAYAAERWTEPKAVSQQTVISSEPEIVADAASRLHTVFAVPVNEGRGIYYTFSNDGETWTQPDQVFDAANANWIAVGQPSLAVDEFGFLHAVWLRLALPDSGSLEGVYYARSLDGGESWSEPFAVAEGSFGWPQVVVAGAGQVHLVWQGVNGRSDWWHRHSPDAGKAWTSPVRLPGFGNVGAPTELMVDDSGALHLVGLSLNSTEASALRHTTWDGERWMASEEFLLEMDGLEPGVSAIMNDALGQLDVILRGEIQGEKGGQVVLWHSGRQVPTVAMNPAVEFVPQPTPMPTATSLPTPTPWPTQTFGGASPSAGGGTDLLLPILLAVAGGVLIVTVVVGTRLLLKGR